MSDMTSANDIACPVCFHLHMGYNDEPCVSCGCDPTCAQILAAHEERVRDAMSRSYGTEDEWFRLVVMSDDGGVIPTGVPEGMVDAIIAAAREEPKDATRV